MIGSRLLFCALALAAAASVSAALAEADYGHVTAFSHDEIAVYTRDGKPAGKAKAADFGKTPTPIVEISPMNAIGLKRADGQVVFLRQLDVTTDKQKICVDLKDEAHPRDRQLAATTMGAGASANCVIGK